MFSWFKKNAQDAVKDMHMEKYISEGEAGDIKINPSPNTIGTNVQQHIEKIDIPISDAPKIPASEVKKYTKSQLDKKAADEKVKADSEQYKASGDVEKLQYPTKTDAAPSVKQPGLESNKDAAGKDYKDPGQKSKLDIPTKMMTTPDVKIVVVTDNKIGTEFKPAGDSEKIMTNPKEFKGPAGQPASNVSPTEYMHKHDKAKPMQKQFSAINWFKRSAVTEEAQEYVSKKIEKNIEEGKPQEQAVAVGMSQAREEKKSSLTNETADFIIRAAQNCPECFDKLVAYIRGMRPKAALSPEEATELKAITEMSSKGSLSEAQRARMQELSTKACQYVEEHEKKHHGAHESVESPAEEREEHDDETDQALAEMASH